MPQLTRRSNGSGEDKPANGAGRGAQPIRPSGESPDRKSSLRAQLQVDDPSSPANAMGALVNAWANWRKQQVMEEPDLSGGGPMSGGGLGGIVRGRASEFGRAMAPRIWGVLNRAPEIYNMNWQGLGPSMRGRARATPIFEQGPGDVPPVRKYGGGDIEYDPWNILANWQKGPARRGPGGGEWPSSRETAGHEMIHQWLGKLYPGEKLTAPQEMVDRLYKQIGRGIDVPLDDPGHNAVYVLARRMLERKPGGNEAAGLKALERGTQDVPPPDWLKSKYMKDTQDLFASPASVFQWIINRAKTPGSASARDLPSLGQR